AAARAAQERDRTMSECEHARRLSAYHDGEVSEAERVSLEAHLEACPACAAERNRLRRLSDLLSAAPRPEMSAEALARLHRTADDAAMADLGRMAKTLMAVAASILLVCAVWLWQSHAAAEPTEPIPAWETAATASQGTLATASDEQLARWIVQDLERKNGHD
ncbi:MAG TPA: zf-HC2 domain-containing protein, partial [Phycisphaerae bacterium]|nr:zf-HC2 domain-containing protein [Phycisphaerae bacterium]